MDDLPTEPVRIPVTGDLDLHTFQPREVASVVGEFLTACVRAGRREVRIVHGEGTGTLRTTVHSVLRRSPQVAGFRLGDETSGGWGATVVALKSPAAAAGRNRSSA